MIKNAQENMVDFLVKGDLIIGVIIGYSQSTIVGPTIHVKGRSTHL